MPLTDLPFTSLVDFRPEVEEPADFDAFWESTLAESRAAGGDVVLTPATTPVTQLIVEDLTFPGFGGEPVRAWVSRPLHADGLSSRPSARLELGNSAAQSAHTNSTRLKMWPSGPIIYARYSGIVRPLATA